MPLFDLKNAVIYMKDGYRDATGKVNLMAGYPIGTLVMVVDGFTVAAPVGATFTMGTDPTRYLISASTTTGLTFTPGLKVAVLDNDVITVGGRQARVKMGDGTLTFSNKRPRQYIKDRGKIDEVRDGDEEPVDVSLDGQWQFITGHASDPGGLPTMQDMLEHEGLATTWISSDTTDPCRPYSVDLEIYYTPLCDTVFGESVLLQYFRYEDLAFDAKAATIKVSGKCNIRRAVGTRFDQTP